LFGAWLRVAQSAQPSESLARPYRVPDVPIRVETVIYGFENRLRSAVEQMRGKPFKPPHIVDAVKLRSAERHNMPQLKARIFFELSKMVEAGKLERRSDCFISPDNSN